MRKANIEGLDINGVTLQTANVIPTSFSDLSGTVGSSQIDSSAIKTINQQSMIGSGNIDVAYPTLTGVSAPTTATVGEVGQFYVETTTPMLYLCTAKTAQGTDPETYEYTWTQQGGGGGGVTISTETASYTPYDLGEEIKSLIANGHQILDIILNEDISISSSNIKQFNIDTSTLAISAGTVGSSSVATSTRWYIKNIPTLGNVTIYSSDMTWSLGNTIATLTQPIHQSSGTALTMGIALYTGRTTKSFTIEYI